MRGGFFKTHCEWASERWSKLFFCYIKESSFLNGNLNTVIMKHILNVFWRELAVPSAVEVRLKGTQEPHHYGGWYPVLKLPVDTQH